MSICIHIPFYNPDPNKKEGFRKLTRYDYLKENIKNLKQLSPNTDIFINTHNSYLDNKKLDAKIIKHNLNDRDLDQGMLTWLTRNNMAKYKDLYKYFMYIEHDIKFTKINFEYWKHYHEKLMNKKFNLGFLIYEKNHEDKSIYSIHFSKKINKVLRYSSEEFAINDIENYCCFWIYEQKVFKDFINSKWWDLNLELSNYKHKYGNTEKAALGLHALNIKYFDTTIIPLKEKNFDPRCLIEHMTNNYFYMFGDKKFKYSDIRSACRFKINELLDNNLRYFNSLPKFLNFKDKIFWRFKLIKKIYRLIKKIL